MIQLKNMCLSFGTQKVFNNISYNINSDEKVGFVGLNGSGKSTLLKIIAQQQEYDSGSIQIISKKKIGYMPQEVTLSSTKSVIDEVMSSAEIIDESETESIKAEAKKMLMSLGFTLKQIEQHVTELSIGWRMRVVLAKLLLQKADFYLFDEPTNHLDIITKEWFLNFLKRASFGFLLVCHERYFLDNICTSIFELENGNGTPYKGNYSDYERQKNERFKSLEAQYTQQQKEIERKQSTINRFKASATKASAAKSMQKALDKIEKIALPNQIKRVEFKLPKIEPSGQTVITLNNVQHKFDSKKIFSNISFLVERNEKIAIIAANGVGKTTLLNVIMKKYELQNGNITLGYNVISAFFEQDQVAALNPEKTIFETMQSAAPKVTDLAIRGMLGCFLFTQDLIHKKTKVLSGGERNRLSMAKVLLQQANLLILDEPTNHLDIISKEIMLNALKQYNGTILFVSHDQDFINNLSTHIIELTSTGAYKYTGNYEEYLYHKKFVEEKTEPTNEKIPLKESNIKKNSFEQNKEIKKLENQINKIEKEIDQISQELAYYEYESEEFSSRYEKISELQKKHKILFTSWEQALK